VSELIPNEFSTFKLTDQEALEGCILTITQKEVLHNLLAANASELLGLEYDIKEPSSYIQQEAYKRGAIDVLRFILASSDSAHEVIYPQDNPTQLSE
jgi:hypothetical protein